MKNLLLRLCIFFALAVTPILAIVPQASSTTLSFPGLQPQFQTSGGWFYCEGTTCWLYSPFSVIQGPDDAYVWGAVWFAYYFWLYGSGTY